MAHAARRLLLDGLRAGNTDWAPGRLTSRSTLWQGVVDWPKPDGGFQDDASGASLAIEFKPPGHAKREYLTGLGQAYAYLHEFEFALLIVPERSRDSFQIADFLATTLRTATSRPPIGLVAYKDDPGQPGGLRTLIPVPDRTQPAPSIPRGSKVYWAYWRDLSQIDAFYILDRMDQGASFDDAFDDYWVEARSGRARLWEGAYRSPPPLASRKGTKANTFLSLRQIGAVGAGGALTAEGMRLTRIGKVYGADGVTFRVLLTQMVLLEGRHLDLIFWVDDQQRELEGDDLRLSDNYKKALDRRLQEAGVIPAVPLPGGKQTFLRDEFKLWNKLGLLVPLRRGKYFQPARGLVFNWRAIVSSVNAPAAGDRWM